MQLYNKTAESSGTTFLIEAVLSDCGQTAKVLRCSLFLVPPCGLPEFRIDNDEPNTMIFGDRNLNCDSCALPKSR